ncbi:armadillo-type protein [Morchella snyderi]|nr:armadillo-type protein [Morchella snyderi]
MLHGMLKVPGWAMAEEEISGTTFEFWSSFAEFLLDPEGIDEDQLGIVLMAGKKEILQAVEEFWRKIRIPGGHQSQSWLSWTKDQRDGFMTFRKDVADLVEVVYGVLGAELFRRLVNQVLGALFQADEGSDVVWEDVEASLFCLNSLSDSLSEEPEEDESLEILFGGKLFVILADFGNHIPIKARQTAVSLIGSYSAFFERHSDFLPTVLNFLFISISTPTLARSASKSICSLCASCRGTLTGELSTFLYQYEIFSTTSTADDIAKERVLCAISYVVQALPSDEEKLGPVKRLLGFVEQDVQECLSLVAQQNEDAKEVALLALRCLISIGRGLQVPEDVPILLPGEGPPQPRSFWERGDGLIVQRRLLDIVRTLVISLHEDGEVVDAACAVFRTGFAETTPGPFVFAPQVITGFLLERANNGVRIESVLSTGCTMVSSHSTDGSLDISAEVMQFMEFIVTLVERMQDPQTDPEASQSVVEFLNRMLSRYVNILVQYQPTERMQMLFGFVLNALAVREPLVKKAAATFWATFVSLADQPPPVQAAIDGVVAMCGTALAEKLVWGVGGGAARSEVDSLAEPLKRLVARQVKAKTWLSTALSRDGFPSPNLTDKSKTRFLNTGEISLRGKRGTNQIVKEFWLSARGSEFDCKELSPPLGSLPYRPLLTFRLLGTL